MHSWPPWGGANIQAALAHRAGPARMRRQIELDAKNAAFVDETFDMEKEIRKQVNDLPLADYFTYLAELLKANPPGRRTPRSSS